MWLMMSAGPSWLPRIQISRKSSRSELRRMTLRQAKCRLVSRLKLRSSKISPLMTSYAGLVHGPLQELFEQPGLADLAPEVEVADDEAVVGKLGSAGLAVSGDGSRVVIGSIHLPALGTDLQALSKDRCISRTQQSFQIRGLKSGLRNDEASPSRIIRHPRMIPDEPQLREPGGRGAGQGGGGVVGLDLQDPPRRPRQGREQGQGGRNSSSEADARPVSRLPNASMISTGRPPNRTT